jgi:hypothetical protein
MNNYATRWAHIADPAAGTFVSIPQITGYRCAILLLSFRFDTDANVANRFASVYVNEGGQIIGMGGSNLEQTASTSWLYRCHSAGTARAVTSNSVFQYIPIPFFPLPRSGVIIVNFENDQVGDQILNTEILWAVWPEP